MTRSRQTADWGSRAGLAKIVPSSVAVGSGTGSADTLGTVTFSGCSSVSLNGIFTSTYINYRLVANLSGGNATELDVYWRLRANGTDSSGASEYRFAITRLGSNGTSYNQPATGTNQFQFATISNISSEYASATVEVLRPNISSAYTQYHMQNVTLGNTSNLFHSIGGGIITNTTAYDGLTFYPNGGSITGTVSVYGYTK
jgi:hypothetical protein